MALNDLWSADVRRDLILQGLLSDPWAIQSVEKLKAILADAEFDAVKLEAARGNMSRSANIAVLPINGVITPKPTFMSMLFGGTALSDLSAWFKNCMADASVDTVVLNVDSPGGQVYGVDEMASMIADMKGAKKVHAIANNLMASAAYWISAACDSISMTPSAEAGSIGVYGVHVDMSKALEANGISPTIISAGRYKTEGNPYEPLSKEARAAMQDRVDQTYASFVKRVASGRGVSQTAVREGFGEGRVLGAQDALKAGMVDRVETLDAMLSRLGANPSSIKMPMMGEAAGLSIESRKRRLRLAEEGAGGATL